MNSKSSVRLITVPDTAVEQRLDNFLVKTLKGVPKSRLYRMIRSELRINKKRVKPDYRLQAGDVIRVPPIRTQERSPVKPSTQLIEELKQRILFQSKRLIILNKPAHLAVHGGSGLSLGVIEAMRASLPHQTYLELVHRLDRETSGCLLLAQKPSTLKQLHELLRVGGMQKIYRLLVKGYWPHDLKIVDQPLVKNQLQSGERMVYVDAAGKEARTEFKVIQRFAHTTLLEAKPYTGRTHQIRVHAAYAGYPIAGDQKYGEKEFNKQMRAYGCKRLFLHAYALAFELTEPTEQIAVTAPLEPDLLECLQQLT